MKAPLSRFILTLGISISFATPVLGALPGRSQMQMGIAVYGNGTESSDTQSRVAGTEIEARFQHTLTPLLEVRLAGGVQLETGAARLRWAEDFRPKQIQRLKQAHLRWTPLTGLTLMAGAIDQLQWQSPLLLQRQSFPALYESFEHQVASFRFQLEAQQAVPADTSSLQPWGNWPQGMPGFYLERLTIAYTPSDDFRAAFLVSHFLYENLSGPSAYQAQFLGNTVNGMGATAAYAFGFQGFDFGLQTQGRLGKFRPAFSASLLNNSAAPIDKARGWRLATQVEWDGGADFRLVPQLEFFRVASDAAPAFYNDRVFGHGNRQGFGMQIAAKWPLSGIQADARWVHSSVLTANPYQSSLDWVQVQLSAQYDIF